jgi:hypothetical protein
MFELITHGCGRTDVMALFINARRYPPWGVLPTKYFGLGVKEKTVSETLVSCKAA